MAHFDNDTKLVKIDMKTVCEHLPLTSTMEICNGVIAYYKLMHFFVKSNSTKLGIKVEKI